MPDLITRFAPSPTGALHLGHAYSALFAFDAAIATNGRFLLRLEDIDLARCRPEFETSIIEDLHWLGLRWPEPPRRQSDHFDDYQTALGKLDGMGLIYPCFCTRRDIEREIAMSGHAPHGPAGALYPGTCRSLGSRDRQARIAQGRSHAWRLDVAKAQAMVNTITVGDLRWHDRERGWIQARPETLGDVVLARKDIPASYHLAVTVDDHLQGITLVTRGIDLFHATHVHRLLQALLGYEPPEYHHHPLLTDDTGKRFAKRDRSVTLGELRERGVTPAALRQMIETRLGRVY